ncbi:MAG: SlyX family protein [Mariprofundaceae bacterium]|nr:SlyX family protein [Mariprofundaceae bacterium]
MDLEHRLIELETKISYQDHLMQALNEVITSQQRQIDALERNVQRIQDYLKQSQSVQSTQLARPDEEAPPPHY